MKKKLLTMLLVLSMCFSLAACSGSSGSSGDTKKDKKTETNGSADSGNEAKEEKEPEDDGIINFDGENYNVTYVRHEQSTDYKGKPCLLYYYNFTNNKESEAASAMASTYVKAFQNGVQCEIAILTDSNESVDNYMKEVQPGTTIEVCLSFLLSDTSDVTIEASDLMSFDNKKDTQILTLQ